MSIANQLEVIRKNLGEHTKLIAISKTQPVQDILECYNAGQKAFGENKVQEMVEKHALLPADIEWHFVGHLQTNKVKFIASFVALIHAVDSLKLLMEINAQAKKNNRIIPCLLQIYIAEEETKFGLSKEEAAEMLHSEEFLKLQNIKICGLMGMATMTDDKNKIREEFRSLKLFFVELKNNFYKNDADFKEISMGMSGDFEIAIEEGSTMVRVGSLIFGERKK